jgi:hypothetical protein
LPYSEKEVFTIKLEELLNQMGISTDATEWKFVLKHIAINFPVDVAKLDCISGYSCKFSHVSSQDVLQIDGKSGYVVGATAGLVVICPAVNDFPITAFVSKKEIRVIESESKMFKAFVRVKTNDDVYIFQCDKKQMKDLENLVNKVRRD